MTPDPPPPIRVRLDGEGPSAGRRFNSAFRMGRGVECDLRFDTDVVSRVHAEVLFESGTWILRDKGSTNGCYAGGVRVAEQILTGASTVQLGQEGPILHFTVESPVAATTGASRFTRHERKSIDRYIEHYARSDDADAGEHTMMIRKAFATVQKKQKKRYYWIGAAALVVVLVLAGFAAYQQSLITKQRAAAAGLFTDMKTLDLQIAQIRAVVESSGNAALSEQLEGLEDSRRRMTQRYDGYIEELGIYRKLNEREKVIYKMARVFNESEFGMPAAFADSVELMIRTYWQTPAGRGRYMKAIRTAEDNGFTGRIVRKMQQRGLPAQFFYLALQESNFNLEAIGPQTRWGRAKGMWQFIPATAKRYELDPGPYADLNMVDPLDDRHNFEKSTDAASRYLQEIYGTLAQASGLLVVASYNWGEHRIVDRLEQLPGPQSIPKEALEGIPADPGSRNYWAFLDRYRDRMPAETKDYVLKIFAAAVIGESPRLFGFDMDNPLQPYLERGASE